MSHMLDGHTQLGMSSKPLNMDSKSRRSVGFRVVLVILLILHLFHAFIQGGGGWRAKHDGLGGAIHRFFAMSFGDPVLSAGLSDFGAVVGMLGFWMYTDLAPNERRHPRTFIWLTIYILFPGLGALLYPLWIRPAHRLATGHG